LVFSVNYKNTAEIRLFLCSGMKWISGVFDKKNDFYLGAFFSQKQEGMNRITWIDNLCGLSILAIIFLHGTIDVHNNAGHFTAFGSLLNEIISPVRRGLMCFVSGLFVDAGLRKGLGACFNNKMV